MFFPGEAKTRPLEYDPPIYVDDMNIYFERGVYKKRTIDRLVVVNAITKAFLFNKEGLSCKLKTRINVYVITFENINSAMHFGSAIDEDKIVYGMYFNDYDQVYTSPFSIERSGGIDFAHEIMHSIYDRCGVKFRSIEEEHAIIGRSEKRLVRILRKIKKTLK